ncbi:Dihydroorotate dehydrogenase B (NAD(+)), electron transfer subunit [Methylobacterium crusticola]|uniref:Dihydroorotate dehydrogenase B (NAD(+)), electron transfer subunit n=1 Tax=Methylobacterium crusticola TaxID=1697972 RepID=A0ABQ4QZ20_9HYPH|nr:oxidoreductase [Methylobacterium crusticola]GJD50652.1 Dihydroorotate dehydrogenase B (NAD(+)), electron transfer subunit [Methylobacterium crusticola]
MRSRCSLVVNGKTVRVATGDTPFEAALPGGVAAGRDGTVQDAVPRLRNTSRTRPRLGDGAGTRPSPAPTPLSALRTVKRAGTLLCATPLGGAVVELVVTVSRPLDVAPGQAVEVAFAGLPPRPYCPTQRIDGTTELNELVFHVRADCGAVGPALGGTVRPGHVVRVKGPAGGTPYRPGPGRLVLAAAETGFAPIWAIARAARYLEAGREMVLVVGARDADDLYMRPALDWLRQTGVQQITLAASRERRGLADVRSGPVTAYLSGLRPSDTVHVAGPPDLVRGVEMLCAGAGATCIGLPFLPTRSRARSLVTPGDAGAQRGM